MLFGIAGPTASGKTTVTNFLTETYHAPQMRYSAVLSEIAKERGLDPTDKATLQELYVTLRTERGEGWLAEEIAARTEGLATEHLVIEGNRRLVDLETLETVAKRRGEEWVLIFIDASADTRFERYNKRLIKQGKPPIDRSTFEILEQNPAEDEVTDLRHYALERGIYINTDEHNIESTLACVAYALKEKGRS